MKNDKETEVLLSANPVSIPSLLSFMLQFVKGNDLSRALSEFQMACANKDNSLYRCDFV